MCLSPPHSPYGTVPCSQAIMLSFQRVRLLLYVCRNSNSIQAFQAERQRQTNYVGVVLIAIAICNTKTISNKICELVNFFVKHALFFNMILSTW